jgi:hypothetical protein
MSPEIERIIETNILSEVETILEVPYCQSCYFSREKLPHVLESMNLFPKVLCGVIAEYDTAVPPNYYSLETYSIGYLACRRGFQSVPGCKFSARLIVEFLQYDDYRKGLSEKVPAPTIFSEPSRLPSYSTIRRIANLVGLPLKDRSSLKLKELLIAIKKLTRHIYDTSKDLSHLAFTIDPSSVVELVNIQDPGARYERRVSHTQGRITNLQNRIIDLQNQLVVWQQRLGNDTDNYIQQEKLLRLYD